MWWLVNIPVPQISARQVPFLDTTSPLQKPALKIPEFTSTWTPKVGKIIALTAIIMGLMLLFYILLGYRYLFQQGHVHVRGFAV